MDCVVGIGMRIDILLYIASLFFKLTKQRDIYEEGNYDEYVIIRM